MKRTTQGVLLSLLLAGCAPPASDPTMMTDGPAPPAEPPPSTRPAQVPPPLSGGTLLVARDGRTAVAADPDRDRVWLVDLADRALRGEVILRDGDEPGRSAEDAAGRVHVVLRGGGALLTIDLASRAVVARRAVCPAPRGVAYAAEGDQLHVACAGGELVSLPAAGGAALRTLRLERDLRDVVVQGGRLFVSRFRAAQVLELGGDGAVLRRAQPALAQDGASPAVAWRLAPLPGGGLVAVHQRAVPRLSTRPGGYTPPQRPPCTGVGVNHAALTLFADGLTPAPTPPLPAAVLPIDVAVSPSGTELAVLAAGNGRADGLAQVLVVPRGQLADSATCPRPTPLPCPNRSVIALAYDGRGQVVAQTREPPALYLLPDTTPIALPGQSRADPGLDLFHTATPAQMACASCHPEGGDDGRVWDLQPLGPRRTQNMRGGVLATAPFHWSGDMVDFEHLMTDVFASRMSGPTPTAAQTTAVARWLDVQPTTPPSPADRASAERGRLLFQDANVGCAECHSGARLTNNQTMDVGTGGRFQVPSLLGLGARAPYLHTGCAPTLRERFSACGGGASHGRTWILKEDQLDDLVSYLDSL